MDFPKWAVHVLGLTIALTVIAGCGGGPRTSHLVSGPATSIAFNGSTPRVHPKREKSWMLPGAKKQSLLYVSNQGSGNVTVYTYADGGGLTLVGTLTGFSLPAGMCTDNAGNVWVPDYNSATINEYAHGGTMPIAQIHLHAGHPDDCAVDTNTGNVAVAVYIPNQKDSYPYGIVDVFINGNGKGIRYFPADGYFTEVYFLAYDNQSNLYADGVGYSGVTALFELPKGGKAFTQLALSGGTLNKPSAINWIKPTLLLGDQNFQGQGTNGAYKLLVSGSTATVVGTLPFNGTQQAFGFWRRAGRVIVPDYIGNVVRIYNLSDGSLISTLTTGISMPFGAVVSP